MTLISSYDASNVYVSLKLEIAHLEDVRNGFRGLTSLMSYFGLSDAFSNKRHELPFVSICELASEADRNPTMQDGFYPISSRMRASSNIHSTPLGNKLSVC
jgi:hypothetical protein